MKNSIVVSICNEAISTAGESNTIYSLADNSQLAELCRRFWDSTIDEMYADYGWAFRKVRTQADLISAGDTANEYAVPDNSLRIIGFYLDAGYQVEDESAAVRAKSNSNTVIYSSRIPLFIEYLTTTTDNDRLPPLVRKCLVHLLASKIATAQGKDDTKIMQKYQYWLDRAEENDGTEDEVTHTYDDRFIDCR